MKLNNLEIISSSSSGNAYIYFGDILLDIGVSYSKIKPYVQQIKYILLTHIHGDHLKAKVLQRVLYENPKIKVVCGFFLAKALYEVGINPKNIFVLEVDHSYIIGDYVITPVMAVHDVPNFGYKIHNTKTGYRIFHISDTSEIDHIEAKGYDLYAIEANYDTDEMLREQIKKEEDEYGFSYKKRVLETHLSQLQTINWLDKNRGDNSEWCFIHQHKEKEVNNENSKQQEV